MEVKSCKFSKVSNVWWEITSEGVEGEVKKVKDGRERNRDTTREVIVLEVEVLERREGSDVRWETPTE